MLDGSRGQREAAVTLDEIVAAIAARRKLSLDEVEAHIRKNKPFYAVDWLWRIFWLVRQKEFEPPLEASATEKLVLWLANPLLSARVKSHPLAMRQPAPRVEARKAPAPPPVQAPSPPNANPGETTTAGSKGVP